MITEKIKVREDELSPEYEVGIPKGWRLMSSGRVTNRDKVLVFDQGLDNPPKWRSCMTHKRAGKQVSHFHAAIAYFG